MNRFPSTNVKCKKQVVYNKFNQYASCHSSMLHQLERKLDQLGLGLPDVLGSLNLSLLCMNRTQASLKINIPRKLDICVFTKA